MVWPQLPLYELEGASLVVRQLRLKGPDWTGAARPGSFCTLTSDLWL
jgi:hypothetical protein